MQPQSFIREKFDVLIASSLFLICLGVFAYFGHFAPDSNVTIWLKDIAQGFSYALFTLLGVKVAQRTNPQNAGSTETGDVINLGTPDPPAASKPANKTENEIPLGQ